MGYDAVPPGASVVEFHLTPHGGGTLLKLVHRELPPQAVAQHALGWDQFIPRLVAVCQGDPVPTPEEAMATRASG
jgi:hypothetical protein